MYQYRLLYCYIRIIVILNHIQGGFSRGAHLFPFRTQKLSPLAPMVLLTRESRSPPVFIKSSSTKLMSFFCFYTFARCQMLVLQQGQQWKSFFFSEQRWKKKIVTDSPTRICVGSCLGMRDCPKKIRPKIERI